MFVLDGSESVSNGEFQIALDFISSIARRTDRRSTDALFGFIEYSTGFRALATQEGINGFNTVVQTTTKSAGFTNTGTALNNALDILSASSRSLAVPVIVLITDGPTSMGDLPNLQTAVNRIRSSDMNVVAIGVGPGASDTELRMIASDPTRVFRSQFNDLMSLIPPVGDSVGQFCNPFGCPTTTMSSTPTTTPATTTTPDPTTTPTTTPECNGPGRKMVNLLMTHLFL